MCWGHLFTGCTLSIMVIIIGTGIQSSDPGLSCLHYTLNKLPQKRHQFIYSSPSSRWYLLSAPPTRQVWHKPFFWWVQAQGHSPDTPGTSKNAMSPVNIPLRHQAINLTLPRRVKAWREGPLRFKDASQCAPWPTNRPPPQPECTWPDPCLSNTADWNVKWLGHR